MTRIHPPLRFASPAKGLPCWMIGRALILIALFFVTPLHAQSIDYGSLERLFGEPVTTSVTGSPQRASDVPATMEIITADRKSVV